MSIHFRLNSTSTQPLETLFGRSLNIEDHVASMAASGENAVGGVRAGEIGLGESVTWQARHFGINFRMTSLITELDAPHGFVDQQIKGPFRDFRHEHRFTTDDGCTTMIDDITFTAPFGPLGWLVERLVLARYLRRLIEARNDYLCRSV
ncbi:cyclase [Arthrobacter alpinus]|uniref:Cyclase n=1 Tax=Arthrobacter alpinus TaxID=656366 RepID=A0A0M3UG09_9MICC|nr:MULTISPECIES: SRPBCC family protein [Arthrobacter]ALE92265.1 cyclase [Arthrobacter alpinus]